eukprot:COSAG02_NODE_57840_length_279_cov_0.788889_1_plen_62_part_10
MRTAMLLAASSTVHAQVDPLPDDGQPPASLQHELDNAAIDDNVFEPDQSEGASQATTITQAI